MGYDAMNYDEIARKDGDCNVFIYPFYSTYYVHQREWHELLPYDTTNTYGEDVKYPDYQVIKKVYVDDVLVYDNSIHDVSKNGVGISLKAGYYNLSIEIETHKVVDYDKEKYNFDKQTISVLLSVNDDENAYVRILTYYGFDVLETHEQGYSKKTREYYTKRISKYDIKESYVDHHVAQVSKDKLLSTMKGGETYWFNKSVYKHKPKQVAKQIAKYVQSRAKDESFNAVKINYESKYNPNDMYPHMEIEDLGGENGVLNGGYLSYDKDKKRLVYKECNNPTSYKAYAGVDIDGSNSRYYIYNKNNLVGPSLTINGENYVYQFLDESGKAQGFILSFNPSKNAFEVYDVEDGCYSGKAYFYASGSFYAAAEKEGGRWDKSCISATNTVNFLRNTYTTFPSIFETNVSLCKKKDKNGRNYVGQAKNDYAESIYGLGLYHTAYGNELSSVEEATGKKYGLSVVHSFDNFFEFINCDQKGLNGLRLQYLLRSGKVELSHFVNNTAQEHSVLIYKDKIIFQRVPLANRQQHVGIAKNPFRFTVFEYADGEFKELSYLKKIHSLSGVRSRVSLNASPTVAGTVVKTVKTTAKPAQKVEKAVKMAATKPTESNSTKKTTAKTATAQKKVETPVKAKVYPKEYYQRTSITKISETIKDGDKYVIHQVLEDYFCIEIGDDVSDMKGFAFINSHNLREVYFTGSGISWISGEWFRGKKNLSIVEFCEGIKRISCGAFKGTSLCGTVRLPDSLEEIDSRAFAVLEPEKLTISISENTKYESDSFHPATKIVKRKAVKPKKEKAEEKPAVKVETPKVEEKKAPIQKAKPEPPKPYTDFSVEDDFELRESGWGDCEISYIVNEHEVMTIPDKVTNINADTFEICEAEKIRKLVLPAQLKYIEDEALYPLVNLEELVFKDKEEWSVGLFNLNMKVLGKCKVKHIQLPEQYYFVTNGAFAECETLETLSVGYGCHVDEDAVPKTCKVIRRKLDY